MSDPHAGAVAPDPVGASSAAGTARFIARCLLVAAGDERRAAPLPAGGGEWHRRLLLAAGDGRFVRAARSRVFRAVFQAAVGFLLPGIILHYAARKRCLEDWLRRTCAPGGCQQVVILGAGLDTLACRWHGQRPDLLFVELDRPAALDLKDRATTGAQTRRENLTFLPADLGRETLTEALRRCAGFDPAVPTLFVAEGLLMYLPPERVRSLFLAIASLGTAVGPHRFAFTCMEARTDGRIRFRRSNPLVDRWLRWQREPFRWSQAPDALLAFLEPLGFTPRELVSDDTLRTRYLAPAGLRDAPLAAGEWLALAETNVAP